MKNYILILVLLLAACASDSRSVKSGADPHPAARQRPAPVEVQQPARSEPVIPAPKKTEHNIEED